MHVTTQAQAEGTTRPARLPLPLEATLLPDAGMPRAARMSRARGPLLFALICSLAWGVALAAQVDARDVTLRELDMQGKLPTLSDRQIEEAQRTSERGFMVKKLAIAAVEPPLMLLASALGLFALSWLLRGRSQAGQVFTVSAWALVPAALGDLVEAAATLLRGSISPEAGPITPRTFAALAEALGHAASGPAAKLLGAIDVFDLWGVVLLGFGFAAAAQLPTRRALTGTLIAWVCYRLLRFVAIGG